MSEYATYAAQYSDELLNNVLPFWLKNSRDTEGVVFSLASTATALYSISTNLFGYKDGKFGCFRCCTIKSKNTKNGLILRYMAQIFSKNMDVRSIFKFF
jgi:hypothetical protein